MLEALADFGDRFAFAARLVPDGAKRRLASDLGQARLSHRPEQWLGLCLFCSLAAAAFLLLASPLAAAAAAAAVFIALYRWPSTAKRRRARLVERELPSALRAVAAGLDAGVPFEDCLASVRRNYGAASQEFALVLSSMEHGASAPEALAAMAGRTDSLFTKRAASALALAYESGDGAGLRPLAAEHEGVMRARLREYSGKLTVYLLLFIAASAVVPAMFQAFVIVGSGVLDISVSPELALLVPVAVFPAVNAGILAFAYLRKPI